MSRTTTTILSNEDHDALQDLSKNPAANLAINELELNFSKWKIKAIVIESLTIIFCFCSVVIYNWLFNATVSPILGAVIGALNGSLVAWCMTHTHRE